MLLVVVTGKLLLQINKTYDVRKAYADAEDIMILQGLKNKTLNKNGKNMASEKMQSLQDAFLNNVRKNKIPLTIFLVNGVKLQGIVTWFDNFCVLLRRDGHSQLVYKHAISTIMPGQPVHLMDEDPNDATAD